jgi:hypothetical protein
MVLEYVHSNYGQIPVGTPFSIGKKSNGEDLQYSLSDVSNPHMVFCGMSGSGKTHNILNMIDFMIGQGLTFHVLGFHPDFAYSDFYKRGATRYTDSSRINHLKFQYSNSQISLNPFSFDPDKDHGGVVSAVKNMVTVLRLFHKSLGERQEMLLEMCIFEVYRTKGFIQEDDKTWSLSNQVNLPTLYDLLDLLEHIESHLSTELNDSLYHNIYKLRKKVERTKTVMNDPESSSKRASIARDEYKHEVDALKNLFSKLIDQDCLGTREGEFYSGFKKDNVAALKGIVQRMIRSSLFTGVVATPKRGYINFYDISKLHPKDQEVMTFIILTKIYNQAIVQTGEHLNPEYPTTYVVAYEGRYIQSAAKDPMGPVNMIMGGARKYGLGLMVGIQGAHQLSKDMSDNFATKFVVKSDDSSEAELRKFFALSGGDMRKLVAKKNAWVNFGDRPVLIESFK